MPWMRILLIAQLALLVRRHLKLLEAEERTELRRLVAKSKGRPTRNLSGRERAELQRLVQKLEPGELGRVAARRLVGYRRKR